MQHISKEVHQMVIRHLVNGGNESTLCSQLISGQLECDESSIQDIHSDIICWKKNKTPDCCLCQIVLVCIPHGEHRANTNDFTHTPLSYHESATYLLCRKQSLIDNKACL